PGFSRGESLTGHLLAIAHHGDAAGRHHEAAGPVALLVHPDLGPFWDGDVLVDDRVLHHRVAADDRVVEDDGPLHPGPAVDADAGREHRVADQAPGHDDAVADQ